MFKLALSPTFTAPVEVILQGGVRARFDAVFHRLSQAELEALVRALESGEATDADVVAQVLADWSGVADESGSPMDCTPANRARVLDVAGVQGAIVRAFFDSIPRARRGN